MDTLYISVKFILSDSKRNRTGKLQKLADAESINRFHLQCCPGSIE